MIAIRAGCPPADAPPSRTRHATALNAYRTGIMRSSLPPEIADPVGLPGGAAVAGHGLLPTRGGGRDPGPAHARLHRTAILHIVSLEDADTVHETAPHGRRERHRIAPVEPPAQPFAGGRI